MKFVITFLIALLLLLFAPSAFFIILSFIVVGAAGLAALGLWVQIFKKQ